MRELVLSLAVEAGSSSTGLAVLGRLAGNLEQLVNLITEKLTNISMT